MILPAHGIQLESRHGLPLLPLFTRRLFIPFTTLHNVFINEGLRRWDVRYYLAIVQQAGPRSFVIEVAYKVDLSVLDSKLPVTNNLGLRIFCRIGRLLNLCTKVFTARQCVCGIPHYLTFNDYTLPSRRCLWTFFTLVSTQQLVITFIVPFLGRTIPGPFYNVLAIAGSLPHPLAY